jgi:hypothetical protein
MPQELSTARSSLDAFLALRDALARILGLQTVDLLIDRGVTEVRDVHPCLRGVIIEGSELAVDSLTDAFRDCSTDETNAALSALTAVMLLIMARLLGKQVAESIADKLRAQGLRPVRM